MTEDEFKAALTTELQRQTPAAEQKIGALLKVLPPKALRLQFVVFPTQDGDGTFSVQASLTGPDLYVLNKAIRAHASILAVQHTEEGLQPAVPTVNPFDASFPVNDAVVDCAAQWIQEMWTSVGAGNCPIPATIEGHDDYGTQTPIEL